MQVQSTRFSMLYVSVIILLLFYYEAREKHAYYFGILVLWNTRNARVILSQPSVVKRSDSCEYHDGKIVPVQVPVVYLYQACSGTGKARDYEIVSRMTSIESFYTTVVLFS